MHWPVTSSLRARWHKYHLTRTKRSRYSVVKWVLTMIVSDQNWWVNCSLPKAVLGLGVCRLDLEQVKWGDQMGWPSKLTDRELKRDSLLMSCTSPEESVWDVVLKNGLSFFAALKQLVSSSSVICSSKIMARSFRVSSLALSDRRAHIFTASRVDFPYRFLKH